MKLAAPIMYPKGTWRRRRCLHEAGFTLLETMLAVFIFGMAAVALIEAINSSGRTSVAARQKGNVQARLDNLLQEATRDPLWMVENTRVPLVTENEVRDGAFTYIIRREPLELKNQDGNPLQGLYLVRVTARWMDAGREQSAFAETWAYPLIFRPTGMGTPQ
ncbi:type II secretion system protein [Roseimicrobium sp. ORNL1]|uniref:type II secretion system protein n=1 Tax=Roseimicrobium sp. ORNL1 TaxID=2711231 RepID=UPI0013E10D57|nr:type II secretion system protein [Roseimicrobium sp. ORNL1]QIF05349.1 type II secretion system protein [Roseimicrobium sp. ORNL1]